GGNEGAAGGWTSLIATVTDSVTLAPENQHDERAHPRPVHATRLGLEGIPELQHRLRRQAGGSHRVAIVERLAYDLAEAFTDQRIVREHEPCLGTLEERRVESVQTNAAQNGLPSDGRETLVVGQPIHRLEQALIDEW